MLILSSAFLIGIFILQLLKYVPNQQQDANFTHTTLRSLFKSYRSLQFLIVVISILYISYGGLFMYFDFLQIHSNFSKIDYFLKNIIEWLLFISLYQLGSVSINIVGLSRRSLHNRTSRTIALLIPAFAKSMKTGVIVILLRKVISIVYNPRPWLPDVNTVHHVILILGIAWCLLQLIRSLEAIFTLQYSILDEDLDSRKTYTHVVLIKRLAILLLSILTVAALLMTFKEVRNLGRGLLISTGILTAILGVSSKQPLEELLRGIQLAISQPIRLNDTVIVEGELGEISTINLTHVIVTLWDKRQMIVPTNYFLDKPFQNWTHATNDLIGTIFFYVDYQLPIEPIRQKFYEYLKSNELGLWNGHIGLLQVTDIKEHNVELRMLVSADNPQKLFDLQCEIREKMLYTIQQTYPEGLPKIRIESGPGPTKHVELSS